MAKRNLNGCFFGRRIVVSAGGQFFSSVYNVLVDVSFRVAKGPSLPCRRARSALSDEVSRSGVVVGGTWSLVILSVVELSADCKSSLLPTVEKSLEIVVLSR